MARSTTLCGQPRILPVIVLLLLGGLLLPRSAAAQAAPSLLSPANGSIATAGSWPDLRWSSSATAHEVQLAQNAAFSNATIVPVTGWIFRGDDYLNVGTFFWRVRIVGRAWSSARSFSYQPATTLNSPANGSVTYNSTWPELSWTSNGPADYELQVARDSRFSQIQLSAGLNAATFSADSSAVITGTRDIAGTFYRRARTAGSTWAKHRSFTTYDGAAPPTNLTPANNHTTSDGLWPTLMWFSSGNHSYQLQVARTTAFTSTVVDTVVNTFSYRPADTAWMQARIGTFSWRVRVVGGNWSVVRNFVSSPIPTGLAPANGTTTSNGSWPTLSWASTGATRYEVAVSRTTSFSSCVVCQTVTGTSFRPVSSSFMKAQLGTLYWRVRIPGGRWSVTRNFVNRIVTSTGRVVGLR